MYMQLHHLTYTASSRSGKQNAEECHQAGSMARQRLDQSNSTSKYSPGRMAMIPERMHEKGKNILGMRRSLEAECPAMLQTPTLFSPLSFPNSSRDAADLPVGNRKLKPTSRCNID